jgi:hypothetical protein
MLGNCGGDCAALTRASASNVTAAFANIILITEAYKQGRVKGRPTAHVYLISSRISAQACDTFASKHCQFLGWVRL